MRNRIPILCYLLFTIVVLCCKNETKKEETISRKETSVTKEQYRPNFHFTPKANWMNDPNGMFYLDGKYHLYFQYYPEDTVWGPMHWGHATSEDMITWEEHPIALYPDSLGYIFSGSAVVDHNNTSGLERNGKHPVISIFTYRNIQRELAKAEDYETQAIAASYDEGFTWEKYAQNPIIENPGGLKDFRDPKVYYDAVREQWVMVLAAYDETMFYGSKDLINWSYLSSFGKTIGAHDGVWECPDFFKINVNDSGEEKWVLLQSLNPGAPNCGSGTQYFVGDFDGVTFTLDIAFSQELLSNQAFWVDYGRDNYAGVTWANIPKEDGRVLFIGWMSNWDYAQKVPTKSWRSAMTVARELNLIKHNGSYRLISNPVAELEHHFSEISHKLNNEKSNYTMLFESEEGITKHDVSLELTQLVKGKYTFRLSNEDGEHIQFGLDNTKNHFFLNRTESGQINFEKKFADKISYAPLMGPSDRLNVRLLIDEASIEIFYNNGLISMTEIFFPKKPYTKLELNSNFNFEIDQILVREFIMKK